jgi:hypothetical protein
MTQAIDRMTQLLEKDVARGLAFLAAAGRGAGNLERLVARDGAQLMPQEQVRIRDVLGRTRRVVAGAFQANGPAKGGPMESLRRDLMDSLLEHPARRGGARPGAGRPRKGSGGDQSAEDAAS